jgi:long-chain fatty acid transport protein
MVSTQARAVWNPLLAWTDPSKYEPIDYQQTAAGAVAITPDLDFAGQAVDPDADADGHAYGFPLTERATLTVGLGVPGGDLSSNSRNFSLAPSVAYNVSNRLALSIGLDARYFDLSRPNRLYEDVDCVSLEEAGRLPLLTCSNAIAYTPANLVGDQPGALNADGSALGYNLGATLSLSADTRLGMRYRSGMALDVQDETVFYTAGPLLSTDLARLTDQAVIAGLGLPESFAVGASHQFNDRWSLAGDVTWVNWSQFEDVRIDSLRTSPSSSVTSEDWDNTYRYTLGLNYQHSDHWKYRLGAAYDQSPIPGGRLGTTGIPAEDLIWVAFGVGYSPTPRLSLDVGYAYPFLTDPQLYDGLQHNLAGQFQGESDILSAQFKWRFE